MCNKVCLKCGKEVSQLCFSCDCGSNKFAGNKKHYDTLIKDKEFMSNEVD